MHIRSPQSESDFQAILDLINGVSPQPYTLAQLRSWVDNLPPGKVYRLMVAETPGGQVAGYSEVVHQAYEEPGKYYVWTVVDPAWQRQGSGSALLEEAVQFAYSLGANRLVSDVRDNCPEDLQFAETRGFKIERQLYGSVLDLEMFDETPFLVETRGLESNGLRFFSMADEGDTPEARRMLYELNRTTALDIPGRVDFYPYEDFERMVFRSDWYRPEGQLFVADGDTWVGLAAVRLYPETRGSYNLMTGVLKPYRGRKIALSLKLRAIRYARSHQTAWIRTNNDSLNAAMLAINRKLGYQPRPGKYILVRQ